MENVKIILLDLDFTLLNSKRVITEHSVDVLKRAQMQDIFLGFCTNRGIGAIQGFVEQVKPDIVLCNGGACLFFKGELIHLENLSLDDTRAILAKAFEVVGKDTEITVDTYDALYWNRKENKSENYDPNALYDDYSDFKIPALKICVQTENPVHANKIESVSKNIDAIRFSDIPWYKFSSKKSTKENGIDYLCEYLNISPKEIVSFGDDFSDIGMLKKCGIGIAMDNAIPEVKAIANDITLSCDEDGVAVWIEKNILEMKNESISY